MDEQRCFVQFIHPGGEHGMDRTGLKGWNRSARHKRKFLKTRGRYLRNTRPGARSRPGEIVFWGEWEPDSEVQEINHREQGGPRFLHSPFYAPPLLDGSEQNTDPFVFGPQFLYTGCQQHVGDRETQLRRLEPGSLILFGSCRDRSRFALDTVFVVRRHIDHCKGDYRDVLRGKVPDTYRAVTIEPWYAGDVTADRSHRLYFGATPNQRVGGMFSFFPCRPHDSGSPGFARPEIKIPNRTDRINPRLIQGKKLTRDLNISELRELWHEVVGQVLREKHSLGVHAVMPRRRGARGEVRRGVPRRC